MIGRFLLSASTEHHVIKAYFRSGGKVPRILDLDTRWRWVVSFTSRSFYPQGKSPWYLLDRRLGGPQSRSRHGGEENPSNHPARSPALYHWAIPVLDLKYILEFKDHYIISNFHAQFKHTSICHWVPKFRNDLGTLLKWYVFPTDKSMLPAQFLLVLDSSKRIFHYTSR
jgi:hypothetical protein